MTRQGQGTARTRRISSRSVFASEDFPLTVQFHRMHEANLDRHGHEFTELVVIASGLGRHVTDQDDYPIMAGDVFVVQEGRAHGYRNTESLSLYNVLFRERELGLPLQDLRGMDGYHALLSLEPRLRREHRFQSRLRLDMERLSQVRALLDDMRHDLEAGLPGCRAMGVARLLELVCRLARSYSEVRMPAQRPLLRIGAAVAYMESHYTRAVTLAALAAKVHMSERSLLRAFQQALGVTPIDYLIRLRVHQAADRLRREQTSVTEAAFSVGFTDSNYFSRQFKRIMGVSPSAYRRGARPGAAP